MWQAGDLFFDSAIHDYKWRVPAPIGLKIDPRPATLPPCFTQKLRTGAKTTLEIPTDAAFDGWIRIAESHLHAVR